MPQLKIQDAIDYAKKVEEQVEAVAERLNGIENSINELRATIEGVVVSKSESPEDCDEAIARLSEEVKQNKKNIMGHVEIYNTHITQLHMGRK